MRSAGGAPHGRIIFQVDTQAGCMKLNLRSLAAIVVVVLLLLLASQTVFVALQSPREHESGSTAKAAPEILTSNELAQQIEQLIQNSEYSSARWGVSVISLADGSTLYARDSNKLFTPASNMKVYTTGVGLELLGADYRWRTSVYATSQPVNGTVNGDLILYGRGAPDLVGQKGDASLARLADDLFARGIRSVNGNVIGDESYFRGSPIGDGWQWNDLQWYYGAEASALSVNDNMVDVNIVPSAKAGSPAEIKINDPHGYVTVENRIASVTSAERSTIGVHRSLSSNNLEIWGEFPPGAKGFGARLSVHNPALWAANLFVDALKSRGVQVKGEAQARSSRVPVSQRFDPSKAIELAFVQSKPLSEIVRETNKESNNLYAELILRTLGRERGAMLEMKDPPGRERGDDESGVALIRLWLGRNGVDTTHLALHDGSGLSRLNLITPDATARLLVALAKGGSARVFRESLPVAGKDGTLSGRLKNVNQTVQAKTGLLTYDAALSGYLTNSERKEFAFSIICNDHTGRGHAGRLIDQLATLLASYPRYSKPQSEKPQ